MPSLATVRSSWCAREAFCWHSTNPPIPVSALQVLLSKNETCNPLLYYKKTFAIALPRGKSSKFFFSYSAPFCLNMLQYSLPQFSDVGAESMITAFDDGQFVVHNKLVKFQRRIHWHYIVFRPMNCVHPAASRYLHDFKLHVGINLVFQASFGDAVGTEAVIDFKEAIFLNLA
eukprot:TRINITY_DN4199_c0_g2_i1.p1 TRINITY_DN4199_c0_g2~~TRINITY_DN4199_c0_g2_i1.p1  ORF type:complete len:201 (-),score=21.08 TRINITY_DN4199_c0_g2_i1:118-636(-)